METALALATYLVAIIFYLDIIRRAFLCARTGESDQRRKRPSLATPIMTVIDVAFLRRLFLVNKPLWIGEWLFHVSFVVVVLGHLRFFFLSVPQWVGCFQAMSEYAGYILSFSLLYIFIYRFAVERGRDVSSYNVFLTGVIFFIGVSGVLMRTSLRPDIVEIKHFVLQVLVFRPEVAPGSPVFLVHYVLALLLIASLPSHVFTAPFVAWEARKREEEVERLLDDE
jgi:nitrate reductase gamma subunit